MNVAYASPDLIRSFSLHANFGRDDGYDGGGSSQKQMACYVILHLGQSSKTNISTLLQIISASEANVVHDESVTIHPILLRVLLQSYSMSKKDDDDAIETHADDDTRCKYNVQVKSYEQNDIDELGVTSGWLEKIVIKDIQNNLPTNSVANEKITISLSYMCSNSEKYRKYFKEAGYKNEGIQLLKETLADMVIAEGTILGIDHGSKSVAGVAGSYSQEISFFMVDKIDRGGTRSNLRHVHLSKNMSFNVTLRSKTTAKNSLFSKDNTPSQYCCPGYRSVLDELLNLASFGNPDGKPSAVVLSGCAGVGKTRIASWLEDEMFRTRQVVSVKVSAKDILLEEASCMFDVSRVIDQLGQRHDKSMLLVIDDLDVVLEDNDSLESKHESEQLRAMNAVAKLIDQTIAIYPSECFILGLCRASWADLPIQLARVGRFEKLITMSSPTQLQRKDIFHYWLSTLPIVVDIDASKQLNEWTELLSPRTAGCVASDIRRICADALTSALARAQAPTAGKPEDTNVTWDDVKEAARRCIPSQLASMDVITATPGDCSNENKTLRQREEFDIAWKSFGGYHEEKKRLYTAIVRPWKYHMDHADANPCSEVTASSTGTTLGFSKPSGVLFHGPSGCGKSAAVLCLASSMGLHCVKIKASEVFNQWLGGSEANLRSIFSRARAASPCILFFDELDALAMNRESHDSDAMSGLQSRILTTLLNEMDGITNTGGKQDILVVAATNRINSIDAALLRPGRLEEHVLLSYPSAETVKEILLLQTSKMPLDDSIDFEEMSRTLSSVSCSCAEVEGICRDACLIAIRRCSTDESSDNDISVTRSDFDDAFKRIKRVSMKA